MDTLYIYIMYDSITSKQIIGQVLFWAS